MQAPRANDPTSRWLAPSHRSMPWITWPELQLLPLTWPPAQRVGPSHLAWVLAVDTRLMPPMPAPWPHPDARPRPKLDYVQWRGIGLMTYVRLIMVVDPCPPNFSTSLYLAYYLVDFSMDMLSWLVKMIQPTLIADQRSGNFCMVGPTCCPRM